MLNGSAKLDMAATAADSYKGVNADGVETILKRLGLTWPNATIAWSARADFKAAAAAVGVALSLGTATTSTPAAGAKQVETFTALGNITATGNLAITVTGAGIAGSPLAVPVAVVNGDTPAVWGGKVRAALAASAAVTALYDVGGAGAVVTLTRKTEVANDGTLNIGAAAGTAANASLPLNSANTTPGVVAAGTVLSGTINGEIRGTAMPAADKMLMVLMVNTGCELSVTGPFTGSVAPNNVTLFAALNDAAGLHGDFISEDLEVSAVGGAGLLEIVAFAFND